MTAGRPRIAILGAGRAGCSFHWNLQQRNHDVVALWTRSAETAKAAVSAGFPAVCGPLPKVLARADVVLLAVSDGAIEALATELASTPDLLAPSATIAHLAGSRDLAPLQPLRAPGRSIGSLHPLTSIATRTTAFAGSACAVESSDVRAQARLEGLARDLGMFVVRPKGDRAAYHAAACLVGNYPQVLMEAAIRLLVNNGLTRDEARRALGPLLVGAAQNAASHEGGAGLTGPIARGDVTVVRQHLEAIAKVGGATGVQALYRAGGAMASDLARAAHPEQSAELDVLLR